MLRRGRNCNSPLTAEVKTSSRKRTVSESRSRSNSNVVVQTLGGLHSKSVNRVLKSPCSVVVVNNDQPVRRSATEYGVISGICSYPFPSKEGARLLIVQPFRPLSERSPVDVRVLRPAVCREDLDASLLPPADNGSNGVGLVQA